jgi:hypothetical protein
MLGVLFTCAGPWPLLLGICQECEFVVVVICADLFIMGEKEISKSHF